MGQSCRAHNTVNAALVTHRRHRLGGRVASFRPTTSYSFCQSARRWTKDATMASDRKLSLTSSPLTQSIRAPPVALRRPSGLCVLSGFDVPPLRQGHGYWKVNALSGTRFSDETGLVATHSGVRASVARNYLARRQTCVPTTGFRSASTIPFTSPARMAESCESVPSAFGNSAPGVPPGRGG